MFLFMDIILINNVNSGSICTLLRYSPERDVRAPPLSQPSGSICPTRLRAKRFPFVALQGDHVKRYLRHDIFESEWGSISSCTRTAGVRLGSGRAGHEMPLFTGVPAILPGLEGLARVSGYGALVSDRG